MTDQKLPKMNAFILRLLFIFLGIPGRLYFRVVCDSGSAFRRDPQRPRLIIFNHSSHLDILILSYCIGYEQSKRVLFVAKQELFKHPLVSQFMRSMGAFPVDRNAMDINAIRTILKVLQLGHHVVLAPEGTRSDTGEIGAFNSTFIKLAQKANALILPMGIQGAFKALPKHHLLPRPYRITARCGEEIDIADYPGKSQDELSEMVRQQVIWLSSV